MLSSNDFVVGCLDSCYLMQTEPGKTQSKFKNRYGAEIVGVRLTAGGFMIDFRYRVLDPVKASALFDPKVRPYLIEDSSGANF